MIYKSRAEVAEREKKKDWAETRLKTEGQLVGWAGKGMGSKVKGWRGARRR
jgi:hypothetical protein